MRRSLSFRKNTIVLALASASIPSLHAAQLEEIVVTAQKRVQSVQDVPISVDVVQARDLANRAINNAQDLAVSTPSVQFQKGGMPFSNNFVIRGVGSLSFEGGIQPSVSMVVDGVPLSRISEFSADVGDVERIEILRGPQGTLYGRNATGGVVSIVRAAPTSETDGYAQQTITGDGEYTTRLMYNTALTDHVNMRLSGTYTDRDEYIDNVNPNNPDLGGEETFGVLAKFNVRVSEGTELLFSADYRNQKTSEGAQHVDVVESVANSGAATGGIDPVSGLSYDVIGAIRTAAIGAGDPVRGQQAIDDPFKTGQDFEQQGDMEAYGLSLDLTHELSDKLTLKSVTAYRSSASYSGIDVDNSAANATNPLGLGLVSLVNTNFSTRPADEAIANEVEYFSEELRLESSGENMDWIGGIYLSHMEEIADNSAPTALFNNGIFRADPKQSTATWDSYAIFGDLTVQLTESLSAFAGLRWTQEEMDIDYSNAVYQIPFIDLGSGVVVPSSAVTWGEDFSSIDVDNPALSTPIAAFGGLTLLDLLTSSTEFSRQDTSADWSGRMGLTWDFSSDAQTYLSVSRGFVGAGANIGRSATVDNAVLDPSIAQAIELGLKSRWFDGSVQLNGALFWQEVDDLQSSRLVPGTINTVTINAGTVTTQGLELSVDWGPTEYLTLGANIALQDSELSDLIQPCYTGQTAVQGCSIDNGGGTFAQDVSGNNMIYTPELAYSVSSRYDIPVNTLPFDLYAMLSYTWQDDVQMQLTYDPLTVQEQYGLLDLTLGFESKEGNWTVLVIGKNITDEYFANTLTASAGYAGQGRVLSRSTRNAQAYWGVTARYNF
ncbi:TonB-dependent receptor [Halioxenophilus aromaticivorans]|uniref:TonB-dependent receptor n=1 Tax=Halioxenophilus aromaticivorans TaxID=1306992 RepID=A0AAV3U6X0_9ALTE